MPIIMNKIKYSPRFFLGANSPGGFVSRFDSLYNPEEGWFCYIIKGGPGTGKSTLMKKLAEKATENDIQTELIHCSSDPSSLDAVIFPDLKCCMADGTAPHTIDPIYPGASDTILNLGEFWDENMLESTKKEIIKLTKKNSAFHMRSKRYLSACGSIDNDIAKIINESSYKEKICQYTSRLSKKLFKSKPGKYGRESIRFISAISPDGIIFFEDTIKNFYPQVTIIEDTYGITGGSILNNIRLSALQNGYNVITCFSPMSPKNRVECLLVPEKGIAFAVSDFRRPLNSIDKAKRIHIKRFIDAAKLSNFKRRLSFNRKIEIELLNESIQSLKDAKSIHDRLEELYIKSMDFKKIDSLTEEISSRLFK